MVSEGAPCGIKGSGVVSQKVPGRPVCYHGIPWGSSGPRGVPGGPVWYQMILCGMYVSYTPDPYNIWDTAAPRRARTTYQGGPHRGTPNPQHGLHDARNARRRLLLTRTVTSTSPASCPASGSCRTAMDDNAPATPSRGGRYSPNDVIHHVVHVGWRAGVGWEPRVCFECGGEGEGGRGGKGRGGDGR